MIENPDRTNVLLAAARNNAAWCDAVCRAHGLPTHLGEELWTSAGRTPPFYPDAVTLDEAVSAPVLLAGIDTESPGCSVKDSFAGLDLAGDGFEVLFDAQWIHRPAGAAAADHGSRLEWSAVTAPEELEAWEAARDGGESGGVFRPALLTGRIAFLAGRAGGRIVAGAVANADAGVVGLSNVFAHDDADTDAAWAGALAAIAVRWPDLDVVGYESGADVDTALRHGFTAIGPLRIWLHTA
ncbi:hypothetical protein [Streptomyces sp. NPDC088762]|uniref:hypothetical protein n=1 Tax=Streptomyces sp. NPDC088762 TaxID=3365891 RepID=UPI0037F3DB54